jgi:cellulose synthase/poly-beta-1,6-N-acetylglucosamine synthase-like glycosyltransferase
LTSLFYISAFLLLYAYVLYPALLFALSASQLRRDDFDGDSAAAAATAAPSLSIIVAAYNEEGCIAQKIENFLACRYSGDAELIVISDGSGDRTAEIAEAMASERVRVIRQRERRGKGVAVNAGAAAAHGEVLVFTDANAMFAADALEKVALPLRDKSIGLVTGVSRYPGQTMGSAYQRYEQMLKGLESRLGAVAGADGALYAMRRELFTPVLGFEMLFALVAAIGWIATRRGTDGKATFAYQFVALNCAQAVGLWRCFAGEVPVLWEPRKL